MNGVLVALACLVMAVSARAPTPKERLVNHLLNGYQRSVDPGTTALEYGVYVSCIHFDDSTGIAELNLGEFARWTDSRLSWRPSEHQGQQELIVPLEQLWSPDIKLNNALKSDNDHQQTRAAISANGTVFTEQASHYHVRCQKSGNNAECKLYFASWVYPQSVVSVRTYKSGVDLDFYDEACPSVISSHHAEVSNNQYPGWPEIYPSLDLTFVVSRRA